MFDAAPPPPIAEQVQTVAQAPSWDLTAGLVAATVQIDQPIAGTEQRTVGTGFLVSAPGPGGAPRVVLVTAAHVFNNFPDADARIGWRFERPDGDWRFAPEPLRIRNDQGQPLWTQHPQRDVAAMVITAPPEFARAAIPLAWLADEQTVKALEVSAADEVATLGFPRGLSSNRVGFPILRVGRVASAPLTPFSAFPTFLIDMRVFPGNSGGPVFWASPLRRRPDAPQSPYPIVLGLLAREVQVGEERLDLGVVAPASQIREVIAQLPQ